MTCLPNYPDGVAAQGDRCRSGGLRWLAMIGEEDEARDLAQLVVVQCGSLERTVDLFEPYQLLDAAGAVVAPAGAYLRELAACGRSAATQRSYGLGLLRWFRFLWAVG